MLFYLLLFLSLIKSQELNKEKKEIITIINNNNNIVNNNNNNNNNKEEDNYDESLIESSNSSSISIITSGELGDSTTSTESRDGLFASLDNDGNGKITLDELTKFIEGSEEKTSDEQNDIKNQVTNTTMSQLDSNNDNILKMEDLSVYWSSLGSLLSVEEVVDWITHSLLMPDSIVQSFIDNGITGYDFPELLEADGRLLEQELKITSVITKRRLMKGMKKKLLGVGTPPPIAQIPNIQILEQSLCYTNLQIEWEPVIVQSLNDPSNSFPVHLYRLQKQELTNPLTTISASNTPISTSSLSSNSNSNLKWVTVCEGVDTKCFDKIFTPPIMNDLLDSNLNSNSNNNNNINPSISVSYRLVSWNAIGRSEYRYVKYDITRPSVNVWVASGGLKEECYEQSNTQSLSFLSATELELMHLNSKKLTNIANLNSRPKDQQTNSQVITTDTNSNSNSIAIRLPDILQQQQQQQQKSNGQNVQDIKDSEQLKSQNNLTFTIYDVFIFIYNFFNFLWTVFSTGTTLLTTILSVVPILVTISISYLRLYPPSLNSNSSPDSLHWIHRYIFLPIATRICPMVISCLKLIATIIPSSKSYVLPFVSNLEFTINGESQKQAPTTQPTIRQQRVLKRMNSIRSNGDESVDSQNSAGHDDNDSYSDNDKCYICSQPVKFKISFKKMSFRSRHHCCHCLGIFCSNCGIVTHNNPQCPVRGTCCCRNCDIKINGSSPDVCKLTQQKIITQNNNNNNVNNNNNNNNGNNNNNININTIIECDATSVQSDLTNDTINEEQEQNSTPLNTKKKNKSFVSLFGIGTKKKSENKEMKTITASDTNFSGLPPKASKVRFPSIPTLGRRVISSPPIISLAPPPEITHSSTWPSPTVKDSTATSENFTSNTDLLLHYANFNDLETS